MIPVLRDEISPGPAGADLTLRLHVKIKFHPGKAGQFSTCMQLLWIFLCNYVSLRNWKLILISFDLKFISLSYLDSCSLNKRRPFANVFLNGVLWSFAIFAGKHKCLCLLLIIVNLKACKETPIQVFSYEYWKNFKNTLLAEHLWWLLL